MRVFCAQFSKTFLTPPTHFQSTTQVRADPRGPCTRVPFVPAHGAGLRRRPSSPPFLITGPRTGPDTPGRPRVSPPATRARSSAPASSLLARRVVGPSADASLAARLGRPRNPTATRTASRPRPHPPEPGEGAAGGDRHHRPGATLPQRPHRARRRRPEVSGRQALPLPASPLEGWGLGGPDAACTARAVSDLEGRLPTGAAETGRDRATRRQQSGAAERRGRARADTHQTHVNSHHRHTPQTETDHARCRHSKHMHTTPKDTHHPYRHSTHSRHTPHTDMPHTYAHATHTHHREHTRAHGGRRVALCELPIAVATYTINDQSAQRVTFQGPGLQHRTD